MSKIFRLHTGAGESVQHWQQIPGHLSDNFINTIEDPAGENAQTQITSIPSPFARMDLVRTAFRYINSQNELDGATIYHRMVSDCLDIGEIFFNIESLKDKIEIVEWNSGIVMNGGELDVDANSELGKLINTSNPKHRLLGETLRMYLFQDKKAFNFSELQSCYLLNYKQGPELVNIIGGTSPATLFFSSANDLSFVDIPFANDKVFDDKYCPLHNRRTDFIIFIYSLRVAFNDFSVKFPDVDKYLDQTFSLLDETLKEAIRKIASANYDIDYDVIAVNAANNNAEILGKQLRTKKSGIFVDPTENDFLIDASRTLTGLTPCVLPNEPFNQPLKYAGGTWQKNYHEKVPFLDARPLEERTLPNQSYIKYPYLTVSDFLEPYLIKLPYPIDKDKFFNGNYSADGSDKADHSFILPVKKEFFKYFTGDDLQGVVTDGKKRFEMQQLPGGVKVIIRIPIKNSRHITFSRLYTINQFQDKIQQADEKDNSGIITDNQFTIAVYPFIKLSQDINPHYRVLLVDRDVQPLTKHYNYTLNFFTEANPFTALAIPLPKIRSSKQQVQGVTTAYHIVEKNFDFIEVKNNTSSGLIVPLFKPALAAAKVFKFAIDFGTTNTHIEYKVGNEESKPFDIRDKDIQVGTLHAPNEETETALRNPKLGFGSIQLVEIIRSEFLPFVIGKEAQYKFPQRTVIDDNNAFNPDEPTYALADFNIPFWYLKEDLGINSEITSNLKWNNFKDSKKLERRTKGFLKQLLLMIRNKVLLNGGDLSATEIVWFYPSSMPKFRRNFLQKSWDTYYERYFTNNGKLHKMSESFAPFYYYYYKENVRPHDRPAVSIDIGGGTTDIVVYKSQQPVLLTSFKFAANAIFGDAFGFTSGYNGFVQHYEQKIKTSLSGTVANKLITIYDSLKQKNSSSVELIEFFFSLEDNKDIKNNKLPLSFSKMLADDYEMKIVFVLFYAAIMYHIAKTMKTMNLPVPEYITFSGNGSKVIRLTDTSAALSDLLAYTKIIFEDVYGIENSPPVEFRFYKNPKEITCKGGLECSDFSFFEELEDNIQKILVGTTNDLVIPTAELHYSGIKNDTLVNSVCNEVSLFIDKFFNWNRKFSYYNHFGISPKNFLQYKELLNSKIKVDLISGIEEKLNETQDDTDSNIKETLFFYPLTGALNRLAFKINNDNK